MATAIVMPKQGNTVEECVLTSWKIAKGDSVAEGQVIAEIETDKAAFEVEATAAGTVLELFWDEGDLVPVLVAICAVGEPGEDASGLRPEGSESAPAAAPEAAAADTPAAPAQEGPPAPATPPPAATGGAAPLSPRARKFLADHPFTMPPIRGSGAGGRIMESDVEAAYRAAPRLSPVAAALREEGLAAPAAGTGVGGMIRSGDMGVAAPPPAAAPAPAPAGPVPLAAPTAEDVVEAVPLSNIRKIIAGRLHDSLASTAQYTLNAEADVTGLLALRKRIKARKDSLGLADATLGDMILFAVARALRSHPDLNAEFVDNTLRRHSAVNLGFACDTPRGLLVPVIRNAHLLTLAGISAEVRSLAGAAAAGRISPDLLAGGTFSVSNLGSFGVTTFTPVVNTPQVAILGVGTTVLRPVRTDTGVDYKDFMQFSLTLNHMVVDGAPGARFLQTLAGIIENFELVCAAG